MKRRSSVRDLGELKKARQRSSWEEGTAQLGWPAAKEWADRFLPECPRMWVEAEGGWDLPNCKRIPHSHADQQEIGEAEEGGPFMFLIHLQTQKPKMYQAMSPSHWKEDQVRHRKCFSNDFWPGYVTENRAGWFKPAVNTEWRREKCQLFRSCPAGTLEELLSWQLCCTTSRAGVKPNKPEGYQFRRRVLN